MKHAGYAKAAIGLLPFWLVLPVHASVQVDQALALMRATCSLPNTALEIKPTPEGRLELVIALASGQRRALALARTDLDTFTEAATKAVANQPTDLTGCMNPYIDEVMAGLTQLPAKPTGLPAPPVAVPPPVVAAPSAPALPKTGDLPVGLINNPGSATVVAVAAPGAAAAPPAADLVVKVNGCRAAGRHVVCDVKVANNTSKDMKLVIQGAYSKLLGEDGSQLQAIWASMGNQQGDMRYGTHQAVLNLIAGAAPVVNLTFHDVPSALTAIKRLEVSMGAQTTGGVELQKVTLADVAIQGR